MLYALMHITFRKLIKRGFNSIIDLAAFYRLLGSSCIGSVFQNMIEAVRQLCPPLYKRSLPLAKIYAGLVESECTNCKHLTTPKFSLLIFVLKSTFIIILRDLCEPTASTFVSEIARSFLKTNFVPRFLSSL